MKKSKVTIVIPTWNRKADLLENIKSIKKSTYANFSIVVVDDFSSDSTKEALEKAFPDVVIIRNKRNMGASLSRNTGMKLALKESEYIFFLDSDVIVDKNTIRRLVDVLGSNKNLGAVTPTVLYFDNPKKVQYAHVGIDLWTGINKSGPPLDTKRPYQTQLCGGNFMVKVSVAKKVGYFDLIYRIYYEDADYSMRIRAAGYAIFYVPMAKTWHKMPSLDKVESTRRWLAHSYYTSRNKIIFMRRYGKCFPIFVLFYPVYIVYYVYKSLRYRNLKALSDFFKGILEVA